MCRAYFDHATMGKSNLKVGKTQKIHWCSKKLLVRALVASKGKSKTNSKSKTTTLTNFDNLKKKQQDKAVKTDITLKVLLLKISNLKSKKDRSSST